MAIRALTRPEARVVALNYLSNHSKAKTYKLYNPAWDKLKRVTVHNNTYNLFHQPLVSMSITEIQTAVLEKTMKKLEVTHASMVKLMMDICGEARAAKQYSAAVSAGKDVNAMMKHYDKISDDAITLDVCMRRPPAPELRAVSPPPALPTA